jgi:cytochrome c-type biogenesis protein
VDLIARVLLWLEPYLADGLELLEGGSVAAALLVIPAGVALGLSPLSYPLFLVVVGYVSGGEKLSRGRAAALSGVFVLGMTTVYVGFGVLFGVLGLALLSALNRSIWLWYALLAPVLWVMGLRTLGILRFDSPLKHLTLLLRGPFSLARRVNDEPPRRRGLLGAYLIGLPSGLAGCPSCALIVPALLSAVAASGSPATGAAAMLMLGLGQGAVLVAAGTVGARLVASSRLAGFRGAVEITLGLVLLLIAAYFTWRVSIWL